MLFYLSIVLIFASLVILIINPKKGLLVTLAVKPIIDTTWDNVFFGMKLTYIMGVGVPLIILVHAISNEEEESIFRVPLIWFWASYLLWNFLTTQMITYKTGLGGLNIFFRILNGFVGYYMFQRYFRKKEDFKNLLLALLLAGVFPIGIGVFQFLTGYTWKAWTSEGGIRNIGLYHDQATLKYYLFQTVAAILLYWSYFIDREKVIKATMAVYFTLCVPVLYKLYVKSGNAVFALWVLIWTGLRRKFLLLGSFILAVFLLNIVLENRIFEGIYNVFQKEIGAVTGEMAFEKSFAGRWYGWKVWFDEWQNSSILVKLFGSGEKGIGAHNDYIFVVTRSGIMGLLLYLSLVFAIAGALLFNLLRGATPLRVVSLMLISLWLVDSIGLVPSGYPSLQWFVWGLIGLSLRLDKEEESWLSMHSERTYRNPAHR